MWCGPLLPNRGIEPSWLCPWYIHGEQHGGSCDKCPQGYYCPEKTTDFRLTPCPTGSFCSNATQHATQHLCPRGTYNNQTRRVSANDCVVCPAGKYCGEDGLAEPSGDCDAGWYCTGGAIQPTPVRIGVPDVKHNTCACAANNQPTGGVCPSGHYCPDNGTTAPTVCDGGSFCASVQLLAVTGSCSAGYMCIGGAATPTPNDNTTGKTCPFGHHCKEGAVSATPCFPGTFSGPSAAQCTPCTAGSYCDEAELPEPAGLCKQGAYCPAGQSVAAPASKECPSGFHCPNATITPVECNNGYFQDTPGSAGCKLCLPGFFCPALVPGTNGVATRLDHAAQLLPRLSTAQRAPPGKSPCRVSARLALQHHTGGLRQGVSCRAQSGHYCADRPGFHGPERAVQGWVLLHRRHINHPGSTLPTGILLRARVENGHSVPTGDHRPPNWAPEQVGVLAVPRRHVLRHRRYYEFRENVRRWILLYAGCIRLDQPAVPCRLFLRTWKHHPRSLPCRDLFQPNGAIQLEPVQVVPAWLLL